MAQLAREPKIAVFVDWHNIVRLRNNDIDLDALLNFIHTLGRPVRQYIYLADFTEFNTPKQNQAYQRLVKSLHNRQFAIKEKPVEILVVDGDSGEEKMDGNLDVELAIDVMKTLYQVPDLDKVVLFSGDGDFQMLLWEVRRFRRLNPIQTLVISRKRRINRRRLAVHADQYLDLENTSIQIHEIRTIDEIQTRLPVVKAQAV